MGQYFNAIIKTCDALYTSNLQVGDDFNGYKLMEHSWLGNPGVNHVMSRLLKGDARIAWVGDYAVDSYREYTLQPEGKGFFPWIENYDTEKINQYLDDLNGNNAIPLDTSADWLFRTFDPTNHYLVNHDKKCYLDMEKYAEQNMVNNWCIHPLPILTSFGNGLGGGDFYPSDGSGSSAIGSWCMDLLGLAGSKPEGYEEVEYIFKE